MFSRYVAIGDSTSEGLDDPDGQGGYRGWANRLAEKLAALAGGQVLYANLAIRGRETSQIHREQLAPALAMKPDLATVVAGVNDLLRPSFDARALRPHLREMFGALGAQGATVLTFTMPDMTPVMPLARALRGRIEALNAVVRQTAKETGALVAEVAHHPVASDPRLWSDDRLHANSLGHARIAEALAQRLGLPNADPRWTEPLPNPPSSGLAQVFSAELAWTRRHLLPWLGRHLHGRSSGDARVPKRPQLAPFPGS